MDCYCVIRMDLINSRKIEQRQEVQKQLIEHLMRMNTRYTEDLAAPITMILGDEWIIVLKNGTKTYEIYLEIKHFLSKYGVELYTGIGYGSVAGDAKDVRKMNGSAFERASESLKIAKSNKYAYLKKIPTKHCNVYLSGFLEENGTNYNEILNAVVQNNEILFGKITEKQYECIQLYEKYQSYTEILAHEPEMTKRMLSDCLNTAEYWLIRENINMIQRLLQQVFSGQFSEYSTRTVL